MQTHLPVVLFMLLVHHFLSNILHIMSFFNIMFTFTFFFTFIMFQIDAAVVGMMDDDALADFIPLLGDRIAVRNFCTETFCDKPSRKQALLEKLRKSCGSKTKGTRAVMKTRRRLEPAPQLELALAVVRNLLT